MELGKLFTKEIFRRHLEEMVKRAEGEMTGSCVIETKARKEV